eukprot:scaffold616_cov89-Phaeocystis_antarctica.AAC.1
MFLTRANRVQLDSLHAGEWVRVGYAARYGVLFGWLRGLIEGCRHRVGHAVGGEFSFVKRIVVAVQCHKIHGKHKLPAYSARCSAYDEAMRLVPAYTTLLNTTFAL